MNECPLCTIPDREELPYSDDLVYLVPTIDDKGHKVRVMVCTHRHIEKPNFIEQIRAITVLYDYMRLVMGWNVWYLCSGEFATIPEHYHVVACDDKGTFDELKQLEKTTKVRFPLGF